jgi:two-component system cell cycle sensor histidine kinase/response regulator CckA
LTLRIVPSIPETDLYRLIFEANPQPTWVVDLKTMAFLIVNDAAVHLYGFSRDEFLSLRLPDIEDSPTLPEFLGFEGASKPRHGNQSRKHRTKEGKLISVEVSWSRLAIGDVDAVLSVNAVVSDRERAEGASTDWEQRFRSLVENAFDAISLVASDGKILYLSPSIERITGETPEERVGLNGFDFVHPDDKARVKALLDQAVNEPRTPVRATLRAWHKGGFWRSLEVVLISHLQDPNVGAIVCNLRDITDNEVNEKALQESEKRFLQAQQIGKLGSWTWDVASDRVSWSDELCRIYGMEPQQSVGSFQAYLDRVHPEDRKRAKQVIENAFRERKQFSLEERVIRPGGEVRWLYSTGAVIVDSAGEPTRMIGVCHDITADKRAEEALRASETKYRSLVENLPGIVWTEDFRCRTTFVSPGVTRILGFTPEEVCGGGENFWSRRIHSDDAGRVLEAWESLVAGGVLFDVEYRIQRRDGGWIWVHDHALGTYEQEGMGYADGILSVITERKMLEEQLLQAQKIEAVGQLAGGVAHDFNNILGVILGYSALLVKETDPSDPRMRRIEQIEKAATRAASLTRQLLAFSRKQMLVPEVVDCGQLVTDLNVMLHRLIGEHIELSAVLPKLPARVKADRGQLEQAIVNLAVNARDAMPQGGSLTLKVDPVVLDSSFVELHLGSRPGSYVALAVSDTGIGMDTECKKHIFEPFFTTKARGKGTGLGLATVYGIVKQSGGYITVLSEPGQGSTLTIYLPRVEERLEDAKGVGEQGLGLQGTETILLVEDEVSLRELIRAILEENGYRVLAAGNGAEGLSTARAQTGPIPLVLTDVVMPGMSGREMAEQLRSLRPETKALYMSGYTDEALGDQGAITRGTHLLQKPFSSDALLRKVREVLDEPS